MLPSYEICSRVSVKGDVTRCDCFGGHPGERMDDYCRKALVAVVAKRAPDILSDHHASASEKVDAYECFLGRCWAERWVRCASARKMPHMMWRGLSGPFAKPFAKQLRADLRAVRFPLDSASSAEGSQWWVFSEKEGVARQASRGGWGEVLTQSRAWLISSRDAGWDSMEEVTKDSWP